MNYIITLVLLVVGIWMFNSLVNTYMLSHKELDLFTCRILMLIVLVVLVDFAKQQNMLATLSVLLILLFIEKLRIIQRSVK
ncbi:phage-like protein [Staphylococcus schweitzeri]|uniref:Phage-like protein n=1 Tax=Staphylococcus schweitzeri TaxID=1654388 RepID=A0A077VPJ9_9STAP|nr:phage-like protein [Staphylococcus schweitzeri]CDR62165.1 phage-like protein [Staphylococcus schweitzeri]